MAITEANLNNKIKNLGSVFGLTTRMCFDENEIKEFLRISKTFISLNGATGGTQENIPLPLAGHFVIWCNDTIFHKLRLLRSEIQSYVRSNEYNLRKINRIIQIFSTIYLCIDHIVFTTRNNIPDGISYNNALRHLETFSRYNTRNYPTFLECCFKQWFEKIETEYNTLEMHCREKVDIYDISEMTTWQYIRSFFDRQYWWETVTKGPYGIIPYKWKSDSYENLRKNVHSRANVIFNRREDIQTSLDTFEQFNLTLQSELNEIRDHPDSRTNNPINQQRAISFANECDRYFALIRSQIGFLQENQNFNN